MERKAAMSDKSRSFEESKSHFDLYKKKIELFRRSL